jgi:hypothetical protein
MSREGSTRFEELPAATPMTVVSLRAAVFRVKERLKSP